METWENPSDQPVAGASLPLDPETKNYLFEAAKWAKFMGIVGYVFIGFMVLGAFFIGTFMSFLTRNATPQTTDSPFNSGMFSIVMGVYFLLIALLYYFPTRYLHQFGVKTQLALRTHEQFDFSEAFSKLKSFFKFFGILTIIMLVLYGAALLFMVVFGALMGNATQGAQ